MTNLGCFKYRIAVYTVSEPEISQIKRPGSDSGDFEWKI